MWLLEQLVAYLADTLGVPVSTTMPVDRTGDKAYVKEDMLTVVWEGGNGTRFIEQPRISFHAWSTSDIGAARLLDRAIRALDACPAYLVNVGEATQNSRYSNVYVDGTPRWTAVYVFIVNK